MLIPTRYRCVFTLLDAWEPPVFLGSAWRGALGHALRKVLCVKPPRTECKDCELRARCLYPLFYDEPLLGEEFTPARMKDPPRPFVLEPDALPEWLDGGDMLGVNVVLFGESAEWLPALLRGMADLRGLGAERAGVRLQEVWQEVVPGEWYPLLDEEGQLQQYTPQVPTVPELPDRVTLTLVTPLRLKNKGRPATPENFSFNLLAQNLARRMLLLDSLYGGAQRGEYDNLPPVAAELGRELRWIELKRRSNRQRKDIPIDGLLGTLELHGPALESIWEMLWTGQWFHAGNGTVMGLGQYVLSAD